MNPPPVSRRDFVRTAALTAAAAPLVSLLRGADAPAPAVARPAAAPSVTADGKTAVLRWLDGRAPAAHGGVTWGVAWPRGQYARDTAFALRSAAGESVPVQSWPTAFWPDGSLKWTAHTVPADLPASERFELAPGTPAAPAKPVTVAETPEAIEVDTGVIRARLPRKGAALIAAVVRNGQEVLRNGRLVALSDDRPADGGGSVKTAALQSEIETVAVEQGGPVRAVVKITGRHSGEGRAWLPFSVRLYFHAGAEAVRVMHSFVFDGDETKDFVRGLGLRFEVPLHDLPHDRHVRFVGDDHGLWAEAVRGLTGLRRDPDKGAATSAIKQAQLAGRACPPLETFARDVRERLQYIPAWGDHTLFQSAANAFTLRKRTTAGFGWVDVDQGRRAGGTGYVGGATGGGVLFGLRDFWQRHPTQLDIRGADTDAAEVTLWLWSPSAPAMDLRFYHDVMGMDTYEKQYNGGLDITYEDYEPGWGTAHGIARSSEIFLWVLAGTPTRERTVALADVVRTPPTLACAPEHLLAARVFGGMWSLPDRATPAKAALEDRLDWQLAFYRQQVEQRHWYGFWNYGDVMHTYDADRHVWRYDVGGFAWDNSELSPDLWLWLYFLRTGRADVFRFAETMLRHTGEVDVYHAGRFAGLGSRHNVQHWGCSAKQVRISTAAYRRIYYFLTADERVGDLMRELLDVDAKLDAVDPARKLKDAPPKGPFTARVSFGTDWANLAAAWLTEWERGGDPKYRDKLLRGMRDFGAAPQGFFSSERYGYDAATGGITALPRKAGDRITVSHLDGMFGVGETFAELIQLTEGQPEYAGFEQAWLQYCDLYNAGAEAQVAALGKPLAGNAFGQTHSRLTAYVAMRRKDPVLAKRAWRDFYTGPRLLEGGTQLQTAKVEGPTVLNPVDEATWLSTNDAAQWGLAAIECLALVGDATPA